MLSRVIVSWMLRSRTLKLAELQQLLPAPLQAYTGIRLIFATSRGR